MPIGLPSECLEPPFELPKQPPGFELREGQRLGCLFSNINDNAEKELGYALTKNTINFVFIVENHEQGLGG